MDPVRLQYLMLVPGNVRLVIDLQQDVGVPSIKQPIADTANRIQHRVFVQQPLILSEVENPKDHDHAHIVAGVDNAFGAGAVIR